MSLTCGLSADERAVTIDGTVHRGAVSGAGPADLTFRQAGSERSLRLDELRQISLAESGFRQLVPGPLRRVTLWSGERLTGDLREVSETGLVWEFSAGGQVILPRAAIAQVSHPAGELNFQYDDFERISPAWIAEPGPAVLDDSHCGSGRHSLRLGPAPQELLFRLAEPLQSGRMELDFYDTAMPSRALDCLCEWEFGSETNTARVHVLLAGSQGQHAVNVAADVGGGMVQPERQRILRRTGWHRLALTIISDRFQMAIDEQWLAGGIVPPGGLRSIRLAARPVSSSESGLDAGLDPPCVWVDDFKLHRRIPFPSATAGLPDDQDLIVRSGGDELYGTLGTLTPQSVTLRGVFGSVQLPWTEVADLRLRRVVGHGPPAHGWWMRIEFQGPDGEPVENSDWIWAALQSTTDEQLVAKHATLGLLKLPRQRIRRIQPLFFGTQLSVESAVRHLGDEIREAFQQPLPDGTDWECSVTLDEIPAGDQYLALDAADLEPAGPATPRDRPWLGRLRAGHLRTELWLNGKRVDELNRHVSSVAPSGRPVRLRIPIPGNLLKRGDNRLRLLQKSGGGVPASYDDCEISNVALEFEQSQSQRLKARD